MLLEKIQCYKKKVQLKNHVYWLTSCSLKGIEFDKDGGQFSKTENDFGKWSVGAKLKLSNSSWYNVDVSKDGVEAMGQGFPDKNMQGGTKSPVKVIYSNGESELIK